jgi:hypothetical protein
MNASDFVQQWEPKIGEASARNMWVATRFGAAAGFLTPVWGILLAFGSQMGRSFQHSLGLVLLAAAILLLIISFVYLFRLRRSLSVHFSRSISILHLPSARAGRFDEWLRKYGTE